MALESAKNGKQMLSNDIGNVETHGTSAVCTCYKNISVKLKRTTDNNSSEESLRLHPHIAHSKSFTATNIQFSLSCQLKKTVHVVYLWRVLEKYYSIYIFFLCVN
jgi:hypothetical protein